MRLASIIAMVGLIGCQRGQGEDDVVLPRVPPDTVVVSWSFISRSADRRSTHVVLQASRDLTITTRSASGTMMSVERQVPKDDYRQLVGRLRKLDCCSLHSTEKERPHPAEAKPLLEIEFGDLSCEVELWDREWREGLARECGFAFAEVHRTGFVPDRPVDDPSR